MNALVNFITIFGSTLGVIGSVAIFVWLLGRYTLRGGNPWWAVGAFVWFGFLISVALFVFAIVTNS